MKCKFRGEKVAFFNELPIGQAFFFGGEMYLTIFPIFENRSREEMNAVSLEDGRLVVFDPLEEVIPCKLNGYFEPAALGE